MTIEAIGRQMTDAGIKFYVWATYKKVQKSKMGDGSVKISASVQMSLILVMILLVFPSMATAQSSSGVSSALSGITDILKEVVEVFIFDWGYYIGIIALAVQGIRWKLGQINIMQLGGWALGICLVFFAPGIVKGIKSSAGTSI